MASLSYVKSEIRPDGCAVAVWFSMYNTSFLVIGLCLHASGQYEDHEPLLSWAQALQPECGACSGDFPKAKEFRELVEFDEAPNWCQLTCDCMLNIERENFHDRRTVSWCDQKAGL